MQVDYYSVLGVEPSASLEEIEAAFETQLAARKAKRQKNGDVHQAMAVLGDRGLRTTYDLQRASSAVSTKLAAVKDTTVDVVSDVIADIDVAEVARQAGETALKGVVLLSGVTARVGDVTASVSRKVQLLAARRLAKSEVES